MALPCWKGFCVGQASAQTRIASTCQALHAEVGLLFPVLARGFLPQFVASITYLTHCPHQCLWFLFYTWLPVITPVCGFCYLPHSLSEPRFVVPVLYLAPCSDPGLWFLFRAWLPILARGFLPLHSWLFLLHKSEHAHTRQLRTLAWKPLAGACLTRPSRWPGWSGTCLCRCPCLRATCCCRARGSACSRRAGWRGAAGWCPTRPHGTCTCVQTSASLRAWERGACEQGHVCMYVCVWMCVDVCACVLGLRL